MISRDMPHDISDVARRGVIADDAARTLAEECEQAATAAPDCFIALLLRAQAEILRRVAGL